MNVELTYRELAEMSTALNNFVSNAKIPAKYAFRFSKVAKHIQSELSNLNDQKEKLIVKYGKEVDTEQGKSIQVTPENSESFMEEWNGILDEKTSLDFVEIPLSGIGETVLTVAEMTVLDMFFVDD